MMRSFENIVAQVVAQARAKAQPGGLVPIAKYANEESFNRLRPHDRLSYQQHCRIVDEAVAALKAAGFRASPIIIDEEEYRQWLGDELNTQLARAKFIATRLTEL